MKLKELHDVHNTGAKLRLADAAASGMQWEVPCHT